MGGNHLPRSEQAEGPGCLNRQSFQTSLNHVLEGIFDSFNDSPFRQSLIRRLQREKAPLARGHQEVQTLYARYLCRKKLGRSAHQLANSQTSLVQALA